MENNKLKYIDLFAGAGGLSEGFIRQGYVPIAHVESDKAACFTLKTRVAFHYLSKIRKEDFYYSYLKGEITREQLYSHVPIELLNTVINAEIGKNNNQIFKSIDSILKDEPVDLIIGGPPCQAYSVVGRAPLKNKESDERKTLYIQYGKFLKKYKPKVFVFENVPGILSASEGKYFKHLQKLYKSIGYKIEAKKLNAYDFGVIQHRERVIIIGCQNNLNFKYPEFDKIEKRNYSNEIFYDLPAIKPGVIKRCQTYSDDINEYLSKTSIRNGVDFVSQHFTRSINAKDKEIYKLAISKLVEGERLKNDKIPENMRTQKNIKDFLDRFKVVANEPHTMIAHISKDGHHFIHPDINQLRSISIREAARIQSFPDDYYFEGIKEDQPKSPAYKQIGNAVPPLMAKEIAFKIKELLNE